MVYGGATGRTLCLAESVATGWRVDYRGRWYMVEACWLR